MSPIEVGIIGWVIFLILLFTGIPIAVAMALVGFLGFSYLVSVQGALSLMGLESFLNVNSYNLSVIPLFVIMGAFAFASGLGRDFFSSLYTWIGRARGGLAIATIAACACFAALCGSSPATAATMGAVAWPEMQRFKYDARLAAGSLAAGGTLGILIPPSIIFIIYGIMTQQSIGKLYMAGILPGILLTGLFIASIYINTRLNPGLGPPGPKTSFKEKVEASKGFVGGFIIFLLVMGGFFIGWFTPSEAGAAGASGVLVLGLIRRKFTRQGFIDALVDSTETTAMIFFIIIGAMIFARFICVTQIPSELSNYLGSLPVSSTVIMTFIIVMYLILGCIMDSLAMILLTVPVIYPIVLKLGFDPIWFGVVTVVVVEAGLITPPVGLNVYIIKGIAKDVPLWQIFQGIVPFFLAILILLIILLAFPQIALFLPNLMK